MILKLHEVAVSVIELVSSQFEVSSEDIIGKSRLRRHYKPRRIAIYLIKRAMPDSTQAEIGEIFGLDHSTIAAAINKARYWEAEINELWKILKLRLEVV